MISALSSTLFWPSSIRLRVEHHAPSVLTQLSTRSVVALPKIAVRKPRYGRSYDDKKAIIHIVNTQILKLAAICLSIIFAKSVYNTLGLSALFIIFFAFIFGTILDFLRWNPEYERCLVKELNERHDELGIAAIPMPESAAELTVRDEVQNISALRERTESDMETETADEKSLREWRESLPKDWVKPTAKQIEAECQRQLAIGKKGSKKLADIKQKCSDFDNNFFGKHIRVNINTGEHIIADSDSEANAEFEKRFGAGIPCFAEHIGHPIYVGGSWGQLHTSK